MPIARAPARLRLVADRDEPLLAFVVRRGGVPEGVAESAIRRGGAFVGAKRVRQPEAVVHAGERVEVTLRAPEVAPLARERILHLDELVLAVDKPAGVAAQDDLAGAPALPQLCSALLREIGEKQTQALLVHRLDRGTTGVTVLARTRRAQAALLAEFRGRGARKVYRAIVAPAPAAGAGTVDVPIESRPASTGWRVLQRFPEAALIEAVPETGRTHQIRIHLAALGCPLLGDKAHGGSRFFTDVRGARHDFQRPMLHALSLALRHPDGGELRLLAPSPDDFVAAESFLRGAAR
jgi:23S rRNA pseudouridine1911/1915/1917 synthase